MSYLEMIRELTDQPTMDDRQAYEWLAARVDEKRRREMRPEEERNPLWLVAEAIRASRVRVPGKGGNDARAA